jgi:hypothetical protein
LLNDIWKSTDESVKQRILFEKQAHFMKVERECCERRMKRDGI